MHAIQIADAKAISVRSKKIIPALQKKRRSNRHIAIDVQDCSSSQRKYIRRSSRTGENRQLRVHGERGDSHFHKNRCSRHRYVEDQTEAGTGLEQPVQRGLSADSPAVSGGASGGLFIGFSFGSLVLLLLLRFWQSLEEGLSWCSAVHAAALMRPALIVTEEEVVENGLHLVDCLEPRAPAFDARCP